MIIDGKKISRDILADVQQRISAQTKNFSLGVLVCAPNTATKQYLGIKERKAREVGIAINIVELPESIDTHGVVRALEEIVENNDGVVVQLPLPDHIDTNVVLGALPAGHDVDRIGVAAEELFYTKHDYTILPPVVGAIAEIMYRHDFLLQDKKVVVLGDGRLVGRPVAAWMQKQGADVTVLNKDSKDIALQTQNADVLVLGAGVAHMITPEMVQDGVVVFDAGASEAGGEVRGDADPAVAQKASLLTPVPGGIGPITIALLLRNLLDITTSS